RFREDLYYRLNVVTIAIPPLRERKEDLPDLVDYLVRRCAREFGREGVRLAPEALERLSRHDWPGNVPELDHCLNQPILLTRPLPQAGDRPDPGPPPLPRRSPPRRAPRSPERVHEGEGPAGPARSRPVRALPASGGGVPGNDGEGRRGADRRGPPGDSRKPRPR